MDGLDVNLHGTAVVAGVLNSLDVAVLVTEAPLQKPRCGLAAASALQRFYMQVRDRFGSRARYGLIERVVGFFTRFAPAHPQMKGVLADAVRFRSVFGRDGDLELVADGFGQLRRADGGAFRPRH